MQQKRKAEQIRDSLLSQIRIIRRVDGDRYIWPHLLDEVAKALPPYTWLVDLSIVGTQPLDTVVDDTSSAHSRITFQIDGRTVDYQAYTQFLRQLEASPWISNVQPDQFPVGGRAGAPGDVVPDQGHVLAGRLGLHPDRAAQPVGEVIPR